MKPTTSTRLTSRRKVRAIAWRLPASAAKERNGEMQFGPVVLPPAPEPKGKPARKPRASKTKAQPTTTESGMTRPRVALTIVTNATGPIAKTFWLNEDGSLGKRSAAQVWDGEVEVVTTDGLDGVSKLIRGLRSNQALTYGIPVVEKAPLVALKRLRAADAPPGAIARTNDEFVFSMGKAGVFMGDYDPRPGYPPLDWSDLDAILCRVLPGYKSVQREWWPSSTSCIRRTDTDKVLQGPGGWRLRLIVDNAANIPAVGDYLFQALFAAGYGYCAVSKSGQVLIRTILDGSVWQPARMDFAAQPVLGEGLSRDAPQPVMIPGAPVLDTTKLQPKTSMAKWRADPDNEPLKKARAAVKDEVKSKRAAYLADRETALRNKGLTDEDIKRNTTALSRAVKEKVLTADAELLCSDGVTVVTVRELLADPERWHQEHFADPLEPDYRDDHRIAIAYLLSDDGKPPVIHSFAHGGATYTLLPDTQPESAEVPDERPAYEIQGCYMVVRRRVPGLPAPGVYFQEPADETTERPPDPEWISTLIEPVAEARDEANEKWGDRFEVVDGDGIRHLVTIGRDAGPMATDGAEFWKVLADRGAKWGPNAKTRARLADYATRWKPSRSVRSVSQTGWHGNTFLTQDRQYGGADEVFFQGRLNDATRMRVAGTYDAWRRNISMLCVGNSRLLFGMSMAFAGPTLMLQQVESGGINLHGDSSEGKTTALHVARSVWGFKLLSWRNTTNGLEGTAAASNDIFMGLDDLGMVDPRELGGMVYMLGNGISKVRMRSDGTLRDPRSWRVFFLSTGEITLAQKLAAAGIKIMAGQEVRLLDIDANAKAGLGIFENLHDYDSGKAFADHLKAAANTHCGHGGRMFLEKLVEDVPGYTQELTRLREAFVEKHGRGVVGQAGRACTRFAAIAAAGELATSFGITGWEEGDAEEAAARCFRDWLSKRPAGKGAAEDEQRIEQVHLFLAMHGESRFATPWEKEVQHVLPNGEAAVAVPVERPTINRAGWRQRDAGGGWIYHIDPIVWRTEVCKGTNAAKTASLLKRRGWLEPGTGNNNSRMQRIPGEGEKPLPVYTIKSSFLSESAPEVFGQ